MIRNNKKKFMCSLITALLIVASFFTGIGVTFAETGDYTTNFGTVNEGAPTVIQSAVGTYSFKAETTGTYSLELKGGAGSAGGGSLPGAAGLGAQLNFSLNLNKDEVVYITITGSPAGGMADVRVGGTDLSNRVAVAGGGGGGGEGSSGSIRNWDGSYTYVTAPGAAGGIGGKYIIKKENEIINAYLESTGDIAAISYNSSVVTGAAGAPQSGSSWSWTGASGRGGDGYAGGTEIVPSPNGWTPKGGAGGGGGLSFIDIDKITVYNHISGTNAGKASVQISMGQVKVMTYDEAVTMINSLVGGSAIPSFTVLQNKPFSLRLTSNSDIQDVTSGAITVRDGEHPGVHIIEGIINTNGWNYVELGGKTIVFHVIEEPNSSNVTVTFN